MPKSINYKQSARSLTGDTIQSCSDNISAAAEHLSLCTLPSGTMIQASSLSVLIRSLYANLGSSNGYKYKFEEACDYLEKEATRINERINQYKEEEKKGLYLSSILSDLGENAFGVIDEDGNWRLNPRTSEEQIERLDGKISELDAQEADLMNQFLSRTFTKEERDELLKRFPALQFEYGLKSGKYRIKNPDQLANNYRSMSVYDNTKAFENAKNTFNRACQYFTGMSYAEYIGELNNISGTRETYNNQKLEVQNQMKLAPYDKRSNNSGFIGNKMSKEDIDKRVKQLANAEDKRYENINNPSYGSLPTKYENRNLHYAYMYMTDKEKAIYLDLFRKDGKDSAEKYLELLEGTINKRIARKETIKIIDSVIVKDDKGKNVYNWYKGEDGRFHYLPVLDTSLGGYVKIGFSGIGSGLYSYGDGLNTLLSGNTTMTADDYLNIYVTEFFSGMEYKGQGTQLLQDMYNINVSLGNMLPTMLLAVLAPEVCLGTSIIEGGIALSKIVAFLSIASSTYGNSYREAINSGNDVNEAIRYGLVSGISEAGLETILGRMPFIGGHSTGAFRIAFKELVGGNVSAAVKLSLTAFVKDIVLNGVEEYLQVYVEGVNRKVNLGQQVNLDELGPEALRAAIYGMILAGGMGIATSPIAGVKINRVASDINGKIDAIYQGHHYVDIGSLITAYAESNYNLEDLTQKYDKIAANKIEQMISPNQKGMQIYTLSDLKFLIRESNNAIINSDSELLTIAKIREHINNDAKINTESNENNVNNGTETNTESNDKMTRLITLGEILANLENNSNIINKGNKGIIASSYFAEEFNDINNYLNRDNNTKNKVNVMGSGIIGRIANYFLNFVNNDSKINQPFLIYIEDTADLGVKNESTDVVKKEVKSISGEEVSNNNETASNDVNNNNESNEQNDNTSKRKNNKESPTGFRIFFDDHNMSPTTMPIEILTAILKDNSNFDNLLNGPLNNIIGKYKVDEYLQAIIQFKSEIQKGNIDSVLTEEETSKLDTLYERALKEIEPRKIQYNEFLDDDTKLKVIFAQRLTNSLTETDLKLLKAYYEENYSVQIHEENAFLVFSDEFLYFTDELADYIKNNNDASIKAYSEWIDSVIEEMNNNKENIKEYYNNLSFSELLDALEGIVETEDSEEFNENEFNRIKEFAIESIFESEAFKSITIYLGMHSDITKRIFSNSDVISYLEKQDINKFIKNSTNPRDISFIFDLVSIPEIQELIKSKVDSAINNNSNINEVFELLNLLKYTTFYSELEAHTWDAILSSDKVSIAEALNLYKNSENNNVPSEEFINKFVDKYLIPNKEIVENFRNNLSNFTREDIHSLIDYMSCLEIVANYSNYSDNSSMESLYDSIFKANKNNNKTTIFNRLGISLDEYNAMFDYINKALLEDNNAVDIEHRQSHLYNFTKYFCVMNGMDGIDISFYYDDSTIAGKHKNKTVVDGENVRLEIAINTKYFTNRHSTDNFFLNNLGTIFHEVYHAFQIYEKENARIDNNGHNKYTLNNAIESVLEEKLGNDYYLANFEGVPNYVYEMNEVDARYGSALLLYNYVKNISPEIIGERTIVDNSGIEYTDPELYFLWEMASNQALYENNSNQAEYNGLVLPRDMILDYYVREDPSGILKKYPVLSWIYNEDGTRKTTVEINNMIKENSLPKDIVEMLNYWMRICNYNLPNMVREVCMLHVNSEVMNRDNRLKMIQTIMAESNFYADESFVNKMNEYVDMNVENGLITKEQAESIKSELDELYNKMKEFYYRENKQNVNDNTDTVEVNEKGIVNTNELIEEEFTSKVKVLNRLISEAKLNMVDILGSNELLYEENIRDVMNNILGDTIIKKDKILSGITVDDLVITVYENGDFNIEISEDYKNRLHELITQDITSTNDESVDDETTRTEDTEEDLFAEWLKDYGIDYNKILAEETNTSDTNKVVFSIPENTKIVPKDFKIAIDGHPEMSPRTMSVETLLSVLNDMENIEKLINDSLYTTIGKYRVDEYLQAIIQFETEIQRGNIDIVITPGASIKLDEIYNRAIKELNPQLMEYNEFLDDDTKLKVIFAQSITDNLTEDDLKILKEYFDKNFSKEKISKNPVIVFTDEYFYYLDNLNEFANKNANSMALELTKRAADRFIETRKLLNNSISSINEFELKEKMIELIEYQNSQMSESELSRYKKFMIIKGLDSSKFVEMLNICSDEELNQLFTNPIVNDILEYSVNTYSVLGRINKYNKPVFNKIVSMKEIQNTVKNSIKELLLKEHNIINAIEIYDLFKGTIFETELREHLSSVYESAEYEIFCKIMYNYVKSALSGAIDLNNSFVSTSDMIIFYRSSSDVISFDIFKQKIINDVLEQNKQIVNKVKNNTESVKLTKEELHALIDYMSCLEILGPNDFQQYEISADEYKEILAFINKTLSENSAAIDKSHYLSHIYNYFKISLQNEFNNNRGDIDSIKKLCRDICQRAQSAGLSRTDAAQYTSLIYTRVLEENQFDTFKDRRNNISIYVSSGLDWSRMKFRSGDVSKVLSSFPKEFTKIIEKVIIFDTFNPSDFYWEEKRSMKAFKSAATGGDRVINYYIYCSLENLKITTAHEIAHSYDQLYTNLWSAEGDRISESRVWLNAMDADKQLNGLTGVTDYARESRSSREDFAEAVALYYTNPSALDKFPNRKALLEMYLPK